MHSIAEIKAALSHMPAKEDLAVWRRDERKGVQRLLASYDKRCARMAAEKERLAALMEPERIFWEQGFVHVAGTDEAGRGPLAGPLVTPLSCPMKLTCRDSMIPRKSLRNAERHFMTKSCSRHLP